MCCCSGAVESSCRSWLGLFILLTVGQVMFENGFLPFAWLYYGQGTRDSHMSSFDLVCANVSWKSSAVKLVELFDTSVYASRSSPDVV